ncbi:MAG TPA: response regulator [Gallionellaceae bacterium]|nr:response regulator [Gallionellaceae bacterium]
MNKPTILLVDDEERILRSLQMLFFTGYNVRITTDAHEAIRILRDEQVHVIVSDQRMPIMQGSELLRVARETSPATMRILLTGYSDMEASIASVNEGEVFRYLLKPWNAVDVKEVVAQAAAIATSTFATQQSPIAAVIETDKQKLRILVMDNDQSTASAVEEILQHRAEVIWSQNEQHAMDILAKQDVSLVVADLTMDGKSVSYILKTVKQFNPQTQIIVLTSFNDTSRLVELINQAQIIRYLPKPIRNNILARNLEFVIERFHALGNTPALQNRQSVEAIKDPQEKQLSGSFMSMLNRLRSRSSLTQN